MKFINKIILLLFLILVFSCNNDDVPEEFSINLEHGFFITNEGPFQSGSGSITFIDNNGTSTQNVYKRVNNEVLGNIVQSMTLHQNKAYIVVNNSHKIIVANRYSMKKITIIEGEHIKNPRYFVVVGNKAYVSNWGHNTGTDDFISVIDLSTNTVIDTIPIDEGPEDMLLIGTKLYVNLEGAFSQNNKIKIIDTTTNTITNTINVGDVPNSILKDNNHNIWVLCGGNPSRTSNETAGKLVQIIDDQIVKIYNFQTNEHPEHLTLNNNSLYYNLNGKIYKTITNQAIITPIEIPTLNGSYYHLKANNNKLYALNAADYASEGMLNVYSLTNNMLIYTKTTGIIPNGIIFQ